MNKLFHFWEGQVKDVYELQDFLDRDLDISMTAEVEISNGELWSVRVTELICYVETEVNNKLVIRHIHLENVLHYELLKELSSFMRDHYLESLNKEPDAMALAKAQKISALEGA